MFDHVIVAQELLPLREAAGKGDIDAMFELADAIVKGRFTKASSEAADPLIDAMLNHPDFRKDLQRFCNTLVMMTHFLQLQWKEGKIDRRTYLQRSCTHLQQMIQCMTLAEPEYWDKVQLRDCLDWIITFEPELKEDAYVATE